MINRLSNNDEPKFIEVKLGVDSSKLDVLEAILIDKNFNRYSIETKKAGTPIVSFYFVTEQEMKDIFGELEEFIEDTDVTKTYRLITERDWMKPMLESLKPFEMIKGVWVLPLKSLEEKDRNLKVEDRDVVIKLIPGAAFGTGLHETTKIAAELLRECVLPGMEVLDVGCGSGILSVLAAKLGAKKVVAVDNDPIAVKKAHETFKINSLEIDAIVSDLFQKVEGRYDLIVSNILFEVLVEVLKDAKNYLKENGRLVLSGISLKKVDDFLKIAVYNKYELVKEIKTGDWYGCVLKNSLKEG